MLFRGNGSLNTHFLFLFFTKWLTGLIKRESAYIPHIYNKLDDPLHLKSCAPIVRFQSCVMIDIHNFEW